VARLFASRSLWLLRALCAACCKAKRTATRTEKKIASAKARSLPLATRACASARGSAARTRDTHGGAENVAYFYVISNVCARLRAPLCASIAARMARIYAHAAIKEERVRCVTPHAYACARTVPPRTALCAHMHTRIIIHSRRIFIFYALSTAFAASRYGRQYRTRGALAFLPHTGEEGGDHTARCPAYAHTAGTRHARTSSTSRTRTHFTCTRLPAHAATSLHARGATALRRVTRCCLRTAHHAYRVRFAGNVRLVHR